MPESASALGDLWFTGCEGAALAVMSLRYWPTVAPLVRQKLRYWDRRARAIDDPFLRALALQKLSEERFNAEAASTFATLTPRAHRASAVEAIVSFQILYDYLDGLTEQPVPEPLRNGHRLFDALIDSVTLDAGVRSGYYDENPQSEDGGYLEELVSSVRDALGKLPAAPVIASALRNGARRVAEAQVRAHAVSQEGTAQLEAWAKREAEHTELQWREVLVGAASAVIGAHALIASAGDQRITRQQAAQIGDIYMSIGAMATMLDGLIDHDGDLGTGRPELGYLQYYPDHAALAQALTTTARRAATRAQTLPSGAYHAMTLVGIVAYYTSAPEAKGELIRPLAKQIQRELRPLIRPTLAFMRAWRLAKRMRSRWRPVSEATIDAADR